MDNCALQVSEENPALLMSKLQANDPASPDVADSKVKKAKKAKRRLGFGVDSYIKKKKRKLQQKTTNVKKETPEQQNDVFQTPTKPMEEEAETAFLGTFSIGTLVWAKLKGFDWWPARIASYLESRRSAPLPGHHWVKWYGDYKFSQVPDMSVSHFGFFSKKYNPSKMRGIYKKAVFEALQFAAKRSKHSFTRLDLLNKEPMKKTQTKKQQKGKAPDTKVSEKPEDEPLSEQEYNDAMIGWALGGFLPDGKEGFAPSEEEMSFQLAKSSSDSEDETTDETKSIEESKDSPTTTSKSRFGKPVNEPDLASDIKALFEEVVDGKRKLEEICLGCGDLKVVARHPLFEGGLCKECKQTFLECSYLFDEDGYQMYCTICGDGKEVFMCDNDGCYRAYCGLCVDMLAGEGTVRSIISEPKWTCFMCTGKPKRLIRRRKDWETKLFELFQSDKVNIYPPPPIYPIIPPEERRPIRVLSLFDGIATGLQALSDLGIEVECYYSSEIDEQANLVSQVHHGNKIINLGDIREITKTKIQSLGPFDLVIGGSPCQDLSIANPIRKGIYEGTGRLFFEYFRLWMDLQPQPDENRPFFWLFENVVGMRANDKKVISRFLYCNPVVVDAKNVSPAHRARYFWGNLPGMNRPIMPVSGDKLSLQECLEPNCNRKARFTKVQTITTNSNSLRQTKKNLLPVVITGQDGLERDDILWCTEMERLFGFPSHYTDVNNINRTQRQQLLGNAWSVPVVRHLLSPLRDYFKSKP